MCIHTLYPLFLTCSTLSFVSQSLVPTFVFVVIVPLSLALTPSSSDPYPLILVVAPRPLWPVSCMCIQTPAPLYLTCTLPFVSQSLAPTFFCVAIVPLLLASTPSGSGLNLSYDPYACVAPILFFPLPPPPTPSRCFLSPVPLFLTSTICTDPYFSVFF